MKALIDIENINNRDKLLQISYTASAKIDRIPQVLIAECDKLHITLCSIVLSSRG